jgi:hypothetical protein
MSSSKATRAVRRPKVAARTVPKEVAPKPAKPMAVPKSNGASASAVATRLATELERALAAGRADVLTPDALQKLMAAMCRTYSAQIEAGNDLTPVVPHSLNSTEVMLMASGLLRSSNLAVFELGMWQTWTGR